jgi:lipopolysaccharide export system protein LptA
VTGALLLALALAAPAPKAAEAVSRGPVRVDADEVQYAFQKHEVTFTGKRPVVLTRGDATLTCRRILARTDDAGQIVTAACTGDVRFVRGPRVVTCDEATFEEAAERVICEGNTVLRDGATEARGAKLVYDLKGDAARLEGSTDAPTVITLPGEEIEQRRRAIEEKRRAGKTAEASKAPGKEHRP